MQMVAGDRKRLLEMMSKDPEMIRLLRRYGYTQAKLEAKDETVVAAMKVIFESAGRLADYEKRLTEAQSRDPQWRAESMLESVHKHVVPFLRNGRWVLAVTPLDIYGEKTNFVFGMAYYGAGTTGLMSAARFTAHFYGDAEHRPRLIARLSKQALSSFGQILGVPRCTDPDCARAYPNSLDEHDAKSGELCAVCAEGFRLKLAKPSL
jgi:predicted Zn-dependent protease